MQNNQFSYKKKSKSFFSSLLTVLLWILIVLAFARLIFSLVYVKVYVVGASMSNTLHGAKNEDVSGGDYVYAFRTSTVHRGDIVIVNTDKTVNNEKKIIIKRVIALGGDKIEVKDGVLYLNGQAEEEPYVLPEHNLSASNDFAEVEVPDGYMFCMGDNRDNSNDSRSEEYGCLPVDRLLGVVAYWSLTFKDGITAFNTFFDFTIPNAFGK